MESNRITKSQCSLLDEFGFRLGLGSAMMVILQMKSEHTRPIYTGPLHIISAIIIITSPDILARAPAFALHLSNTESS